MQRLALRGAAAHAEEIELALDIHAVAVRDAVHDLFIHRDKLRAVHAHRIERARADEVLHRALVHVIAIHAIAEILKIHKGTVDLALAHHAGDQAAADVLDGDEAEADALRLDRKAVIRPVDVRRQERDGALAALADNSIG